MIKLDIYKKREKRRSKGTKVQFQIRKWWGSKKVKRELVKIKSWYDNWGFGYRVGEKFINDLYNKIVKVKMDVF